VRLARLLLDQGLDPNAPLMAGGYRLNPAWFAVAHARNTDLVNFLEGKGAQPIGLFAAARIRLLLDRTVLGGIGVYPSENRRTP
jgi:hypothetical protein